ncbi:MULTISPECIES: ABC transporter ATP-binding protein [Robertmurraya]|uniref:ABC transporter ATP-binding protein n=1 Tax=Robertmurraya beringensis TaxID=641660 RepID=A0ABV6KKT1_9BACI
MKKLFKYIFPYKYATIMALSLTGFELVVELIQPVLMAKIIDEGITNGDMFPVYLWGGILLLLSFIAFVAGIVNSFYSSHVGQAVGYDLRRDLFDKIQQFAFKDFQEIPTSSLITRLTNDVTQIQNFLFMSLRIALRAPLFILGGMIMAFTVNVKLATILLISVPLLMVIVLTLIRKGVTLFQLVQKKLDRVNSIIQENLVGIRLIKAFTRGPHEQGRFEKVNKLLREDNKKALQIMEMTMPILMFGMNVAMVIILWFGSLQLDIGGAQAGEIVAVLNYGTKIMFAFTVFSFVMMNYSRAQASSGRLVEILEQETDAEQLNTPSTGEKIDGRVEFHHVSFQYPQALKRTLDDISFTAEVGQRIGILGETGSGKTSLFQLIPRLFEVTEGHITIDDEDITKYEKEELRKQIGMVPQEAHLFTGTVKENIGWGKENATFDEIIEAAKKAEIHEFIMTLPHQYETMVGQRGVNLSGGQKQRLSIARAIVRQPRILLLDDSTSALDSKTEANILTSIKDQACTTFIIAQKISSVIKSDQILLLEEGMLVAKGTHEQLLKESDSYRRIYKSQMQKEMEQLA